MYAELGRIVRELRERLGLDQGALATKLGISQQTVDRWERGKSRPRRSTLCSVGQLLQIEEQDLVDVGGYRTAGTPSGLPVRSLGRVLPLEQLTEERFEDLLTEVIATLHPEGHASRYGSRGYKQHGIDLLVAAGGTNIAIGQCKRHQRFGPADVQKAIGEVTISAPQNYLFLSQESASPRARAEMDKHSGWELWDGEDISRYIRTLPSGQAVRMVDTYFPGQRASFLGVQEPGPWLMPEDYFEVRQASIFHHDWNLVGRQGQLAQLSERAYSAGSSIALIVGAGGTGKTRVLKALTDAAPRGTDVRLLVGDALVSAADFELLSDGENLTVIIDDAHEITAIGWLVSGIWRRNASARIILATRPYGRQTLQNELSRHGLLPESHLEISLTDLDPDDANTLAREALGDAAPEAVVRRLASLTVDSPLATVVGGVLIRQGKLDPAALERDQNVRAHILGGFRDALVNDDRIEDSATRSAVISALSAVQPFRTNEQAARETLSAIVGKHYDEIHKHLVSLENAGILRRRSESLRVMPDLLGDVILTESAFDEAASRSTGYLERIESAASGSCAEHLFINVSRIDWQIKRKEVSASGLADSLWDAFESRVFASDWFERRGLMDALAKVAYFQPARALRLAKWVTDNPTEHLSQENLTWRILLAEGYRSVLFALPPVLKSIAMHGDFLPDALNQLWALAQADDRPANQSPGHALRVLCELAAFVTGKPIWYLDRIIDVSMSWFVDGQSLSPFKVLEPLLATEGDESRLRDHTISFRPYSLNPQGVDRLRQRVIDLAFEELESRDLRRAAAAAEFLGQALHYPSGTFGREVTDKERAGWTPGFVATIDRLGVVAGNGGLDPAVVVSVREALRRHEFSGNGPTHDAATLAVKSLPVTVESSLALVLHDGWGQMIRDRNHDFEVREAKLLELFRDVIGKLVGLSDEEIVGLVANRLHAIQLVHGPQGGHPGPFVAELVRSRETVGWLLLEKLLADSSPCSIDPVLGTILFVLDERDPATILIHIHTLLDSSVPSRRRAAAQSVGGSLARRDPQPGERELLFDLAADPDPSIRRGIAVSARQMAWRNLSDATRLLAAVRFGDDPWVAEGVFMAFQACYGISWSSFSASELRQIRQDLVVLPKFDDYWVPKALVDLSAADAWNVVEIFKKRVEFAESPDSSGDYLALPYFWEERLEIVGEDELLAILEDVLTWIASAGDSWKRQDLGAQLFAGIGGAFGSCGIGFLANALTAGGEDVVIAIASVLRKAPRTIIWDQSEFVVTVLHEASRFGEEALRAMESALWAATISGSRSGTPGEPYPETIEQRDRCKHLANGMPIGSIEAKFYGEMAMLAEKEIASDASRDQLQDGRDW